MRARSFLRVLDGLYAVQLCRIQAEDLSLVRFRDLGVAVLFAYVLGNLKPPQRFDLPLRRPVPDGIRSKHDPVGSHVFH